MNANLKSKSTLPHHELSGVRSIQTINTIHTQNSSLKQYIDEVNKEDTIQTISSNINQPSSLTDEELQNRCNGVLFERTRTLVNKSTRQHNSQAEFQSEITH